MFDWLQAQLTSLADAAAEVIAMKKSPLPAPIGHNSNHLYARIGAVEQIPIASVVPYERNARKHPEPQLVKLAGSIQQFGFIVPIVVNAERQVLTGRARLDAAKRAGLTEVPAIQVDHLSPAQERAFRLADNRLAELALWDRETLKLEFEEIFKLEDLNVNALGWECAEIDMLLVEENKRDEADKVVEASTSPVSKLGDLWKMEGHRLMCGSALDSEAWALLMDGQVATMVFTDPPYNVPSNGHICGLGSVQHKDFAMAAGEMTSEEFRKFLHTSLAAMAANLAEGGIICCCMDWRHLPELFAALQDAGLSLLNLCVWNKTNAGMGSLYRSKHEMVAIAKKGKAPHINNVQLGKHGRHRTNVWDYAGVNSFGPNRSKDLADHPTVKPIAMVADAIRDVSNIRGIVIDAFGGSGTTILAAERTKRLGYAIEIDPGFVDVAIKRWEEMTGNKAILAATGQSFAEVAAERASADEAVLAEVPPVTIRKRSRPTAAA